MAFPGTPHDVRLEFAPNGGWVDITEDVFDRDGRGVTITRGRTAEAASPEPSMCGLELTNVDGKYSPRNAMGTYFRQFGRNTPMRVTLGLAEDAFGRTVSNGWGSADTGQAWAAVGTASDFSVSGGKGRHSVPARDTIRYTYMASPSHRDVDVVASFALSGISNVTGDAVAGAVVLRWQDTSNYLYMRVGIQADETVKIHARGLVGGTLRSYGTEVTVSGLTYTGAALRVRAQAEGSVLRGKVWTDGTPEPADWHVAAATSEHFISSAGGVGAWTYVSAANTNALPVVSTWDDLEVRSPRFCGEVSTWPQRWNTTGNDAHAPITAAGIRRRLGQGSAPLHSALRRGVESLATPAVAYWACEDERSATEFASVVPGVNALQIDGSPEIASDSDSFDCSKALPKLNLSRWGAILPDYSNPADQLQVRCLLSVPAAGDASGVIMRVHTSGTAAIWDLVYTTTSGGSITLNIYTINAVLLHSTGEIDFDLHGGPCRISVEMDQNGANIDWNLSTIRPGGTAGGISGTLAGRTTGNATAILINPTHALDTTTVGHITVQAEVSSLFELSSQLEAWVGESALDRLERLCAEAGISLDLETPAAVETSPVMGPQAVASLLDLLDQCAAVDRGILYEPRGALGLAYRRLHGLYGQYATLALSYADGELAPPLEPTDDDQLTRNDVTVSRTGGASARYVVEEGPLSIQAPPDGVGRYDTSTAVNVEADSQLPDLAAWLAHLGTVDEPRYPRISMDAKLLTAAKAADLLDLSIGERLTITDAELINVYDDISQLVIGLTERLSTNRLLVTAAAAPESPYQVAEVDDVLFRLDSDASTLAVGVSSSAASLSVAVSDGTLWTTDAAQFPFDIRVGGEVMTVTNITGASSPQTFTVTRSVNGVVKTHSADATVELAQRPTIAL